jgi:hypothetical protein
MKVDARWRKLGWRHPLWDYVRFYTSFRKGTKQRDQWLDKLSNSVFEVESEADLIVPPADMRSFLKYIEEREVNYENAFAKLREKDGALAYCEGLKLKVSMTSTKLEGWTDSPRALVAAVTNIAKLVCDEKHVLLVPNPQRRCVWLHDNSLHVSVRNLDGAIPALYQPRFVWEIKEYWGGGEGKAGGSKMSDAVYECNLVGRELREFEDRTGHPHVDHIVYLDGKDQFGSRDSDLKRMIDLFHQGIIDYLFIGREVENEWQTTLSSLL